MDLPTRVFVHCGDVLKGSFFEVLFYQQADGAQSKLATDRVFVDQETPNTKHRVSLTTDSGLAHYPSRLNDLYQQADVIILVYSLVDRDAFEKLPALHEHIIGPARDFRPVQFILLGIIPSGSSLLNHVVSPQEIDVCATNFGAAKYQLDLTTPPKDLDELWQQSIRLVKKNPKSATSSSNSSLKDENTISLMTNLITKKEWSQNLTESMKLANAKKTDKIFKGALKASGRKEVFSIHPIRTETHNIKILTPTFCSFTITNTTKNQVNWSIVNPEEICYQYFFACSESSGILPKGKSVTIKMCCVFYSTAELAKFVLVECPQEPGLFSPLFVHLVAPLQPVDPQDVWDICRKDISIGFRIASTLNANVYRSTLFGAVVAFKDWQLGPNEPPPEDFKTEWAAFNKIKHPNIAQFLGGHYSNGNAFIVLEYLKYGTLAQFLQQPPPRGIVRTFDLKMKMATDLAKGMAYLHSQKMLHRDLKSSNVLVGEQCAVKLGDFGEARSANSLLHATEAGSLDWTAPELLTGSQHDKKTDIFGFGVILWELAADRFPMRTINDVKNGLLPPLPMEIKSRYPEYTKLFTECVSLDPEQRPSFDDIVDRLEHIRQTGPVESAPTPVAKVPIKAGPPRPVGLPAPVFTTPVNKPTILISPTLLNTLPSESSSSEPSNDAPQSKGKEEPLTSPRSPPHSSVAGSFRIVPTNDGNAQSGPATVNVQKILGSPNAPTKPSLTSTVGPFSKINIPTAAPPPPLDLTALPPMKPVSVVGGMLSPLGTSTLPVLPLPLALTSPRVIPNPPTSESTAAPLLTTFTGFDKAVTLVENAPAWKLDEEESPFEQI